MCSRARSRSRRTGRAADVRRRSAFERACRCRAGARPPCCSTSIRSRCRGAGTCRCGARRHRLLPAARDWPRSRCARREARSRATLRSRLVVEASGGDQATDRHPLYRAGQELHPVGGLDVLARVVRGRGRPRAFVLSPSMLPARPARRFGLFSFREPWQSLIPAPQPQPQKAASTISLACPASVDLGDPILVNGAIAPAHPRRSPWRLMGRVARP